MKPRKIDAVERLVDRIETVPFSITFDHKISFDNKHEVIRKIRRLIAKKENRAHEAGWMGFASNKALWQSWKAYQKENR